MAGGSAVCLLPLFAARSTGPALPARLPPSPPAPVLLPPPALPHRRRPGDYEMHRVERVVVHPDFQADAPQQSSNLALVVLEKASRAKPVALPGGG